MRIDPRSCWLVGRTPAELGGRLPARLATASGPLIRPRETASMGAVGQRRGGNR